MIVDDDDDMRFLIRSVIQRADSGVEIVAEADNGTSAMTSWLAERPDVVITDQRMPGMTGLELTARLHAEDPDVPVILYSAFLDDAMRAQAEAAGVCAVIDKDRYADIPSAIWACVGGPG